MAGRNSASAHAGGFGARGGFPGSEDRVARDGGGVFPDGGKQFAAVWTELFEMPMFSASSG